jgi:NAD(P)-dependent dehydrogenase (short-subunit alcohol dehydrogenase family)
MSVRNVLVVGGSSGIGLATALAMAANGDRLMLVARNGEALAAAEAACRDAGAAEVMTISADVAVADEIQSAVTQTVDAYGRLDVVVHTATVMAYGTIESMPADIFTEVVDIAVHGTLYLAKAVLPVLRRQGRGTFIIVNSLLGSVSVPNMGAYSTAKWGQRAIARTLQQEVRDCKDVHVCIVSPGSINTPIYYQAANYTGSRARPPIPVLQPERAGAVIAKLADHPRQHVSIPVGPGNPIVVTGFRFLPAVYDLLVGPLFKLAALTRQEQPPTDGNVHKPVPGLERTHGHWPDKP